MTSVAYSGACLRTENIIDGLADLSRSLSDRRSALSTRKFFTFLLITVSARYRTKEVPSVLDGLVVPAVCFRYLLTTSFTFNSFHIRNSILASLQSQSLKSAF